MLWDESVKPTSMLIQFSVSVRRYCTDTSSKSCPPSSMAPHVTKSASSPGATSGIGRIGASDRKGVADITGETDAPARLAARRRTWYALSLTSPDSS